MTANFQSRVDAWMDCCFGNVIKADRLERCDRFIEEALELVQTEPTFTIERAHALVDYVFGRSVGEPAQEVGGVKVTLAALCNAFGIDVDDAAESELSRVWTKVDAIRAKQAAKPTGSALPVARGMTALHRQWSVDADDFDWQVSERRMITLDGVVVRFATAYDCDAGTVTRLARNAAGALYCGADGEPAEETLTGVVAVALRP